jgi:hypothetical protein
MDPRMREDDVGWVFCGFEDRISDAIDEKKRANRYRWRVVLKAALS